ncbi:MAG: hypothetical protein E7536_07165 [Ruminococcaceae bacterium]|nr:hypothetical protein [Oscillospiraceae bacterium]
MKKKILSVISIALALITIMSAFSALTVFAGKVITPPIRPVMNKITPTINSVKLEFEYDDDDFQILIYRKDATTGAKWARIAVAKAGSTSYTDNSVSPEKTYYYTIKAYYKDKSDGTEYLTKSSGDYKVTTSLAKPAFSLISNMGKGVVMQWKERSDVSGYAIYRSTTGKKNTWTRIATIKSNKDGQFIDTQVNIGDTFYYCFKAYKTIGGKDYYSASSTVHKRIISGVTPPQNFKAVVKEDGVYITYDKVPGVLGYSIYRREEGSSTWVKINQTRSVNVLGFVDKTAETGKTYYYTAKSYKTVNGKTTSSKSATNVKVINVVSLPSVDITPSEITFKDYYEEITVEIKINNFEKDDKLKVYIDSTEITDELLNNQTKLEDFVKNTKFIYHIDEDKSTDEKIVLNIIRVAPGTGTLKVVHSKYPDINATLKVNCPVLAYDTDYENAVLNAMAGFEAINNAKQILEEAKETTGDQASMVKSAIIQLTGAKSSLENAKLLLIKYEGQYSKYADYKSDLNAVEDCLDAVNDALEDINGTSPKINDAIRELDITLNLDD